VILIFRKTKAGYPGHCFWCHNIMNFYPHRQSLSAVFIGLKIIETK
jgi:hypothetical protein